MLAVYPALELTLGVAPTGAPQLLGSVGVWKGVGKGVCRVCGGGVEGGGRVALVGRGLMLINGI